jgi:hypothetical protein
VCVDRPAKSTSPLGANDDRGAVEVRIRKFSDAVEVAINARLGSGASAVISIVCALVDVGSNAAWTIANRVMDRAFWRSSNCNIAVANLLLLGAPRRFPPS